MLQVKCCKLNVAGCKLLYRAIYNWLSEIFHVIIFCFDEFDAVEFCTEFRYRFFELVPDRDGDILCGSHHIAQKIHIEVEVFMIEFVGDKTAYEPAQVFKVHYIAERRIDFAFDGDEELVIVTVPVGIGTSSEELAVLFIRPFGFEKTMCGGKTFAAGNMNHSAKIVGWNGEWRTEGGERRTEGGERRMESATVEEDGN